MGHKKGRSRSFGDDVKASDLVRTIAVPTPFPVGPVNVHLIRLEPITLVDCGPRTGEAWDALSAGLRAEGLTVTDVERVVLTHGHQDHFGLAARVADVSGARIYGGLLDHKSFRIERNPKKLLEEMARADFGVGVRLAVVGAVAAVDRFATPLEAWDELSGGEVLEGDGWKLLVGATPGHTPGSLTFEVPEANVLFTGDTVLKGITPNAIVEEDPERPGEVFRSVSRYFETLEKIERTSPHATLHTGHGPAITDYSAHRRKVGERYRLRIEQLTRELAKGARTIRELVVALFPFVRTINVFLAYSEVLGFLMYLEDQGMVVRERTALQDRYRLVG